MFFLYLLICLVSGMAGFFFKPGLWYKGLDKPSWTPPDWMFPIVWAGLYVLISLAAARIAGLPGTELALGLWALQIVVSMLWSPVFFGLKQLRTGLVIVACLCVSVLATTVAFAGHDLIAALLLLPFLAWGTFALSLNYSVMRRNETASEFQTDG